MRQSKLHAKYSYQPIRGLSIDLPSDQTSKRLFFRLRNSKKRRGQGLYEDEYFKQRQHRGRMRSIITLLVVSGAVGGWYINQSSASLVPWEERLRVFRTLDFSGVARLPTQSLTELPPAEETQGVDDAPVSALLAQKQKVLSLKLGADDSQVGKLLPLPELEQTAHPAATASIIPPETITPATLTQTPPKLPSLTTSPEAVTENWLSITVQSGDNLSGLFGQHGLSRRALYKILDLGDSVKPLRRLRPGQEIRVQHDSEGDVETVIKTLDFASELHIVKAPDTEQGYTTSIHRHQLETRYNHAQGRIESSLFNAGQQAGLSDRLVLALVGIFGWDIDFALDIQPGDRFSVVYETYLHDGKKVKTGDIVAAEFINNGHVFRAIRYTDPGGYTAYYTPAGDSMQKAFLRTPVKIGHVSSGFTTGRKHPILNKIRAHKGVDYAAPRGTPAYATGNGKIVARKWKGGYGKTVVIQHGDQYTTLYGHLSAYAEGLKEGDRVHQGDLIGYVGSSGLATGPHLHYEFRVDDVHKDPLTVELPKAFPLAAEYTEDFKAFATPLLARLDSANRVAQAE